MNLLSSTYIFSFYTLISRVLGYIRDILIAIFLGASIYADDIEIGKVLINDEYPFALIKYLDKNFKKSSELKSENAVLRINMPNWI